MKNNQNITHQIQTSLKHLGALLFLLLTVIVLINCSEDGGISDADSDTTLRIVSAMGSSAGITSGIVIVFSEQILETINTNNTTLTCTAANGGTGKNTYSFVNQRVGATSILGLAPYTPGETCTLTLTAAITGRDSGKTLPAGTVLFTGVLP